MTPAPKPYTVDRWSDKEGDKGISIKSADGFHIANMVMSLRDDELATARYLCRAANSYAELLEALKSAVARLDGHEGPDDNADLRAAIRKAEGKP